MPSEETNRIKLRILDWLKEEGFSAEETKPGPMASFNILCSMGKNFLDFAWVKSKSLLIYQNNS